MKYDFKLLDFKKSITKKIEMKPKLTHINFAFKPNTLKYVLFCSADNQVTCNIFRNRTK